VNAVNSAWRTLRGLSRDLVDFAYPPACVLCNAPPAGGPVCADCERELATLPAAACSRCRLFVTPGELCPLGHQDLVVRALGLFDGHYQKLLHALKFHGDLRAGVWLGRRLGDVLNREGVAQHVAAVAAVPLHKVRLRERGFNQSAVLAREVAGHLGLPLVSPLLRLRNTPSQTRLDRAGRTLNVRGAFGATGTPGGSPLLLVDDVVTTGATLEACATALRSAGVAQILAVSVALAEPPALRAAA
jgi:ComF family protein